MTRMLYVVPLLGLLAAGCSSEIPIAGTPGQGDTVRHNMAVHILPLPPHPAAGTPTGIPGERASVLMERYNTDTTEPLLGSAYQKRGGSAPKSK